MKTFKELGLSPEFVAMLERASITIPTEIQEKTIPIVLANKDVIGGSATGSGKTLAFASPIIENLKPNKKVQALIMTPTRELAEQVANSIMNFSRFKKLNIVTVYGGVGIGPQIAKIRNADVIVGTPGRILDHLDRGTLKLNSVKFLVLDEVDRMFDMGFQVDVEKILEECPTERQTMLFSATICGEMDHLAQKYTKKPVEVSVKSHIDASKLKQIYYDVPNSLKFSLFVHLIKKEKSKLVMVFCGTRRNVDFVANNLRNLGIKAKAIHGGMIQNKRSRVMEEFNGEGGVNVLVCTDVAARGLDIQGVSHVYNYDLPKTSSEYIHRIGRTARAGKEGIAINILCNRDYENFSNVRMDEKLNIKEIKLPEFERVRIIIEEQRGFRGRGREKSFGGRSNSSRGGRSFGGGRSSRDSRTNSRGGSFGGRNDSRGGSFGGRNDSRGGRSFGGGRNSKPNGRNYSNRGGSDNNRGRDSSRGGRSFGGGRSGGANNSRGGRSFGGGQSNDSRGGRSFGGGQSNNSRGGSFGGGRNSKPSGRNYSNRGGSDNNRGRDSSRGGRSFGGGRSSRDSRTNSRGGRSFGGRDSRNGKNQKSRAKR